MKRTNQGIGKAAYEALGRSLKVPNCWDRESRKIQLAWVRAAQAAIKAAKK